MTKNKIYKTGGYKELIEVVYAIAVSEKSVWFSNGRSSKRSNYANYWDTMEEAKEHLTEKYNVKIKKLEKEINKLKSNLYQLKNL